MNTNQGALYFGAGIDLQQWRNNVNEMRRDILGLTNTTQQQTKQMDTSFRNIGLGLTTYFSGAALGGFVNQIINVRGEFQKTEIAFGTMLKSTDKAKELMGQMVELAAKTPFSLQDVSAGAKQLLAFQVPANEVVDTLTRMGNIAAGLGVPLSRINLVYGQVMAKGKLMGDDLRQFTEAGIPMVAELAKKFGTTTAEISKMVTAGKIGFKDVQDVLFSMTNEGGMFFNLMEKQSKSLSGQIANLGDSFDQMLNSIGESNEGFLSDSISSINYLVQNYETVIEVIGVAVATYGAYRAALIATAAWQQLSAGAAVQQALAQGTLTTAQAYGAAATVTLQRAQASLNATLLANPIGIVIGLVAGLSYVIYKNITATTQWEELQGKLNETTKKGIDNVEEQQSKINTLIGVIRNKNTTDAQAKKALDEINRVTGNRINGLTIEGIRLGKNTSALSAYIEMLKKEARAKALIETITQAEKKEKDILSDPYSKLSWGDEFGNYRDAGDILKDPFTRKREANIEDLTGVWKIKADANAELQKLASEGVDIIENIGANESTALNNSANETEKTAKKKNEAVEKIYGEDTIKGLQQRISKLNEVLETSPIGGSQYNEAKAQKSVYEERLENLTRSFDDEITETKRQIEVRDKLLKSGYDKETVDGMFPQVKDQSFLQYLEKLGAELEKQPGKEAAEDLVKLQGILTDYVGAETFLDNVNKQIENLKSKFSGNELIDKLEAFKKASLEGTTGDENNAKRQAVERAQEEELERQKANYEAFLKEKETFEQKKAAIDAKYDQIDASINGSDNTSDEKARLLAESGKARGKEYSTAFLDGLKNTEMWQKAFGDIAEMTNREIKENIASLKIQVQQATANGATAEEIKVLQDRIKELQGILNNNPFEKIANSFKILRDEAATTAQKLKAAQDMFNGLGEGVNMIGDAFGGFDDATNDAIGNIMDIGNSAFDLAKSISSGDVAGMISAGIKLIGSIGKALSGDNKKERSIKKQAAQLKELETAYNNLAFAAERAFGSQKYNGQRDLIRNLEQQKAVIQGMMNSEASKKKADQEKINGYKSQIQSINQSIAELKEGIIKDVLQTDIPDMASKLGDALLDAFSKGESGVEAINKAFDDLVKNMLKNQLNKILEGQMSGVIANMRAKMGFNADGSGAFDGLTEQEIADLRAQVQSATAQGQQFIDAYSQIFGDLASPAEGLKGDIKGITEKTAGALEAQINAIRIYQVESLNVHRANQLTFIQSLQNLVQIEFNTRNLIQIRQDISEMNSKMAKGLAGIG